MGHRGNREAPSEFADPQIVEDALSATIEIRTEHGLGSGFIVHSAGLAVTARHVVEEPGGSARTVQVRVFGDSGAPQDGPATVFQSHRTLDYAFLWLSGPGPYAILTLGEPGRLRHTDTVFALGSPSGLAKTVSRGIVSNPCATQRGVEYIQTDAAVSAGNSGGPLIDAAGRVVGINLWIMIDVDAARFALPLDYLWGDIKTAWDQGREKCLGAFYCRSCGHTEYYSRTWYCRACGRLETMMQSSL